MLWLMLQALYELRRLLITQINKDEHNKLRTCLRYGHILCFEHILYCIALAFNWGAYVVCTCATYPMLHPIVVKNMYLKVPLSQILLYDFNLWKSLRGLNFGGKSIEPWVGHAFRLNFIFPTLPLYTPLSLLTQSEEGGGGGVLNPGSAIQPFTCTSLCPFY